MNNLALNDADEIITELSVLRSKRNFVIVRELSAQSLLKHCDLFEGGQH